MNDRCRVEFEKWMRSIGCDDESLERTGDTYKWCPSEWSAWRQAWGFPAMPPDVPKPQCPELQGEVTA